MFTCHKCKYGLYLEGNSIIEDTTEGILAEDSCVINPIKRYGVKLLFVCEYCRTQYEWSSVSRFNEFPPKD